MNFFSKIKLKKLRKKVEKAHAIREQQGTNINVANEIKAHYELAKFYEQHRYDKSLPHAETYWLECHRAVASLGEAKAQYICGQQLLEKAKFWDQLSQDPVYGGSTQKKYADMFYEEAFAYLQAAEDQDYYLAKRLLGLANIHAWGKPKNTDAGFKLILDSIEQEKAWDRATKILEELKLNSPEFFTALRNYKGKGE